MSKATKIIVYVVLVLILVAGVALIVKFTNGFTKDFSTFYVTVGEEDIHSQANGYEISEDNPLSVEVKYLLNNAATKVKGYEVKVVPNKVEGKDFDFGIDGDIYSFQAEENLTAGFNIEKGDTSFTIAPKGGMQTIMESVYPNHEITLGENYIYEDMYTLVISSYTGKESVYINFTIPEGVYGITLDTESILF